MSLLGAEDPLFPLLLSPSGDEAAEDDEMEEAAVDAADGTAVNADGTVGDSSTVV